MGSGWRFPPTVTACSCIASSRADCVFGVARLISSASRICPNTGPGWNRSSRPESRSAITSDPMMSAGIRSGVNWDTCEVDPETPAQGLDHLGLPQSGKSFDQRMAARDTGRSASAPRRDRGRRWWRRFQPSASRTCRGTPGRVPCPRQVCCQVRDRGGLRTCRCGHVSLPHAIGIPPGTEIQQQHGECSCQQPLPNGNGDADTAAVAARIHLLRGQAPVPRSAPQGYSGRCGSGGR